MKKYKGLTIVELLVTVAIIGIIMAILATIFVSGWQNFKKQSVNTEVQTQAKLVTNTVTKYVQLADSILATKTILGTEYKIDSNPDNVLILELPSINQSGQNIEGIYDYLAFYQEGDKLKQATDADDASSRKDGTKTIANLISESDGLKFTLNVTSTSQPDSKTIQPGSEGTDAYVFQLWPGMNSGGDAKLNVGQTSAANSSSRSYLLFDLSPIPSGATITISSATLSLYLYDSGSSTNSSTKKVHKVIGNWTETGINWNQPAFEATSSASRNFAASESLGFKDWTIPSTLVQSWLDNPTTNNKGMVIKDDSETTSNTVENFYSSDCTPISSPACTDTTKRPKLVVNYTVVSTPYSDTTLVTTSVNTSQKVYNQTFSTNLSAKAKLRNK